MDRYTLPTGWEDFSDTALSARLEEIESYTGRLTDEDAEFNIDTPGSDDGPSGVEVAESLAEAKRAIEGVLSSRADARAEEESRKAAALAALAPAPEPDPEPEPEPAVAELAAEESVPEPVEAAPVDTPAPAVEAAPEPAPEPDPEPVALAAEETTPAPEPVVETAPVPDKDPATVLANMNGLRSEDEMPRPADNGDRRGAMRTTGTGFHEITGFNADQGLDDLDVLSVYMAERINKRNRNQMAEGAPDDFIPLVTATADFPEDQMLVASDIEHNYSVTAAATRAYASDNEALVAAGGPCAPIPPMYDFTRCFDIQQPIMSGIPAVGAPRGGIRFLDQQPLNAMAAGVDIADAAQGALVPGDAGYTDKPCVRVTCPTETTVSVARISQCVTFDNLNFRVFPEQVRHMLELLQLEYTRRKEVYMLDRIDTLAGAAAAAPANNYGAARSLLQELVTIAHNYRKRNNMNRDAMLDVWLPDVAEDILLVDAANDFNNGGIDQLARGQNNGLAALLATRARLNVKYYYYDSTNGGFPASAHNGAAGAWNALPNAFRSYIHAPGALVRLDGGSLDLGIVRDSTLNAQNDLQMFAEEWFEVARPGCEVVAHDHAPCPNGTGPVGQAANACP